ncbi:MAG: sugar transferase [Planctomycetota bacterium]
MSPFRRLVDILVSGSAILLLSPVYILAGLAVKLTTPGPIIFRQMRAGRGGKPFAFYKFRSMYIDAEARRAALADQNQHDNGPIFKMKNDPRITPVGKFLRKTSIDELPQLFNVLKGDMTLIPGRARRCSARSKYDLAAQAPRHDRQHACIWQVSGRSEIKFDDWVRMDIQYQRSAPFGST